MRQTSAIMQRRTREKGYCHRPYCMVHSGFGIRKHEKGSQDRLGCVEEDDCEVREVGERELVLVVSVRCGKERDMTRGWQNVFGTQVLKLEPRMFA